MPAPALTLIASGTAQPPWQAALDRLRGAGYGPAVPRAYARAAGAVAGACGPEAAVALGGLVSRVAIRAGVRVAEALCARAEAACPRLGGAEGWARWHALFGRLAGEAPESLRPVLERHDRLLAQLGLEGLHDWVLAGLRAAAHDGAAQQAYFSLETPESLRLLERASGHVSFFDVERPMHAFSQALWGRSLPIRVLPGTAEGTGARRCSFAGGVLTMPAGFAGFRGREAALFRAALAHVGAHLHYGQGRFAVGQLKPMQVALVSLIEDARVEHLAMAEMPGLADLWRPFHVAQPGGAAIAPSLFARLARALIDPAFEDPDGWVRKGRAMFLERRAAWHDPAISRHIGNLLGNDLGQLRVQFNAKAHVVEPAYRDDNLGLWEFEEPPSEPLETLEVMVDTVRLRRSEPTTGQNAERQERAEEPPDPPRDEVQKVAPVPEEPEEGRVLASYPEYDFAIGRERPEWATVRAYPRAAGATRFWEELGERHGALLAQIKALVQSAQVGRAQRLKRQAEGEMLDLDACIEAAVALRSGRTPDHRIHEAQTPPQRDLAVSLLLDVSLSTADALPGGGTVLDAQRDAVAVLARAMNDLGDPFAITAFASAGRADVRVTEIKRFGEPLGVPVGAALAGLMAGYSTRIGAALRHAGAGLAGVPRHRRLVLLITDGEPSDIDCPDPDYLVADARRAVQGLSAAGIDVFCIGLGPRNKEREAAIFGRNGFIQIDRIEALPRKLPALYLRMTR